jgi:hypothetical protein
MKGGLMKKKVTWQDVYDDFKSHYPTAGRASYRFEPHDYAMILVYLPDGICMKYNYDEKQAYLVRG